MKQLTKNKTAYARYVPTWALPITRLVFITALCVLTYQSIVPAGESAVVTHHDKVMHAMGYAMLTGLLALAAPRLGLLKLFIIPTLYGGFLEIAQSIMPYGRTGSFLDLLANMVGAGAVVFGFFVAIKLYRALKSPLS
ncbi:MAG: VanZ family protein [Alphaproteobacteria bacterium]